MNSDQCRGNKNYTNTAKELNDLDALEGQIKYLRSSYSELQNITENLYEQIKEYRKVKEEWEWFFENSTEMLCIAGMDGYLKKVNSAFLNNFGYSEEIILSRPLTEFVHPEDLERTANEFESLGKGQDSINFVNRWKDASDDWHWISWHCPVIDGEVTQLYAIARDITQARRTEQEILYQALHDSLTGLYNRAAFDEKLQDAIARAERNNTTKVSLYFIDLDGFKSVNDTYGHLVGDQLLKEIAVRFKEKVRQADNIFRIGGDEFACLVELDVSHNVDVLAKHIINLVSKPIWIGENQIKVGCSIGISFFPQPATSKSELILQADKAMYEIKKTGKNDYKIYEENI
jgi:diguanylate cyclase (GGDEF)-like protein/PAS domain S-box-containing protein